MSAQTHADKLRAIAETMGWTGPSGSTGKGLDLLRAAETLEAHDAALRELEKKLLGAAPGTRSEFMLGIVRAARKAGA